jgi:hypothetical protein
MVARGKEIGSAADDLGINDDELIAYVSKPYWTELVKSFVMSTDELALEYDKLVPVALNIKRRALSSGELPLDERNKIANEVLKSRGLSSIPRESSRKMRVTHIEYLRMSVAEMSENGSNE